jgi:HK97 gp10 family phage protein
MEQVKGAGEAALLQTGADIVDIAKQLVPVDTGALKQSIGAVPIDSTTVRIGSDVEYAPFVEFGSATSPAQAYLIPALAQAEGIFKARLEEQLKEVK